MIRRLIRWAYPILHPRATARHHRAVANHCFDNGPRP